jgi:4-amino-4-deoxychorismate lyase
MFLINGLEQDTLPASDRATQFGDGCFTTARILDGGCWMRISAVCKRL